MLKFKEKQWKDTSKKAQITSCLYMQFASCLVKVTVLRSFSGLDVNKIIFFPCLLLQEIMRKLSIACRNMGRQLANCCIIKYLQQMLLIPGKQCMN